MKSLMTIVTVLVMQLYALTPSTPSVSASDGTYADKVHVSVSGGGILKAPSYKIYRNDISSCAQENGCRLIYSGGTSAYDDTDVKRDTTYYYWAQVCDGTSCSDYSSYDTGYAHLDKPPQTSVSASDGTYPDKVALNIKTLSGAMYYLLYKSEKNSKPADFFAKATSANYDDTAVKVGVTYYYWVEACNDAGCGPASASDSGYAQVAAPPATELYATDGTYTDKIVVKIKPVAEATEYRLYRSEKESLPSNVYVTTTATEYDDTAVTPGRTYYYWVEACNAGGCSTVSKDDSGYAKVPVTVPASTTLDAGDGAYTDKIVVNIAPASGATSYRLYRSTIDTMPSSVYRTLTSTTYDDTSVISGTTYYYWVKACNSAGCSAASVMESGYAKKALTPPSVTSLEASDGTYSDRVHLTIKPATGATSYKLYRSTGKTLPSSVFHTMTDTEYDDTAVTPGTTYFYWVKSCNGAGCSVVSAMEPGFAKKASEGGSFLPPSVSASGDVMKRQIVVRMTSNNSAIQQSQFTLYRCPTDVFAEDSCRMVYRGTNPRFNDTDVLRQATYYYFARECIAGRCTALSRPAEGRVLYMADIDAMWPGTIPDDVYGDMRETMYPSGKERRVTEAEKLTFRIAGLGDSYGSGQGNPSMDGEYVEPWFPATSYTGGIGSGELRKAVWEDDQCKRSSRSGFRYGVAELEKIPLVGELELSDLVDIRFKSYACTGSKTENILDTDRTDLGNSGFEILDPLPIKPQLDQVRDDVERNGPYDAVLLSIGGNDVGFGAAIMTCSLGDCRVNAMDEALQVWEDLYTGKNFEKIMNVSMLPGFLNGNAIVGCSEAFTAAGMDNVIQGWTTEDTLLNTQFNLFFDYVVDTVSNVWQVGTGQKEAWLAACTVGIGSAYQHFANELKAGLANMNDLGHRYARIDQELGDLLTLDAKVNIVEYPNLFFNEEGEYCRLEEEGRFDAVIAGVKAGELEWADINLVQPLLARINETHIDLGWNVVHLPDSLNHGICVEERNANLNIDALEREGENILPFLPLSSGMIHPNDRGFRYEGQQIRETMFPDIARKLDRMNKAPSQVDMIFEKGSVGDMLTLVWNDDSSYETAYKVELYKVNDPFGNPEYHPEDPAKEWNVTRNTVQQAVLKDALDMWTDGTEMVDFRVGTCLVAGEENCTVVEWSDFKRVRYGEIGGEDYAISYDLNASVLVCDGSERNGEIHIAVENSAENAGKVIIAWSDVPSDTTPATMMEYLKDFETKGITVNYVTADINATAGRQYAIFKPHDGLPENYKQKRFAVAAKLCNLRMCTDWSNPILVKYPRYVAGLPTQCNEYNQHDTLGGILRPWELVSSPAGAAVMQPTAAEGTRTIHLMPAGSAR